MKPRGNEFATKGEKGVLGSRPRRPPAVGLLGLLLSLVTILSSVPAHVAGDSGGPDVYGYTWVDSKFPNPGVVYSWADGVAGGTDLLLLDDGCSINRVSFGFPFRFYGIIYSDAYVCANGFIAFDTPAGSAEFTDAYAVALGADLNPDSASAPGTGHVYVKADSLSTPRRFIVTWNGVYTYGTTDPQTFEIVLVENPTGEDGRVLYQYRQLTNPPVHLTGIDSLGGTSSLYYTTALPNLLAIEFRPPGTNPPGDVLTVRTSNLSPVTVEPGQRNVPMLRLNLSTPTNSVNLRRVRVDVTGLTSMAGDVSRIGLWLDTDANGQLNPASDALLVSATPAGSPESVALTLPSPLAVPAGPGTNLFVAFDLPLSAVPGDWIGAGVLGSSYVTVDPPDTVSSANFPINSYQPGVRTHIVEGTDTLRVVSWSATNPADVPRWQTDAPMLYATFDADKGAVTIARVAASFLGTRSADVYLVKLFEDANADLLLEPGTDRLLDSGRFDGTGTVVLGASLQVVAGSPRTLWLSLDISPGAILTDTVGVRIAGPAQIAVVGTKDQVAPDNFPLETTTLSTVRAGSPPAIQSRWAIRSPVPDGRLQSGEYVVSANNTRDLATVGGNTLSARLVVENDASFLYVAYDAVDDASAGANDSGSLGFRTNRSAFPLAPADDEFGIGGPLGPFHAVWNGSTSLWEIEDDCNATFDANHTGLGCSVGFGPSLLSAAAHRTYEFRIPLPLLEVPLPIPAGYTLGLAANSNYSEGVHDADAPANASWPFARPPIPPTFYGDLVLAAAPPADNAPRLDWTGEPGFTADGLSPDTGTTRDTFYFHIRYTDPDGDFPSLGEPRLHLLAGATEVPGSPFSMAGTDPTDTSVVDGKIYSVFQVFSACPGTFSYFFTAEDDLGAPAVPTPTLSGPVVRCPPVAPQLSNASVAPGQGFANTATFTWTVEYRDGDGDAPARIEVTIYKGGSPRLTLPLALQTWLGNPNNYSSGALFGASRNLSAPGSDYSFSFLANDSLLETTTEPAAGPTVVTEPSDLLLVSSSNDAPLQEDQGRRNVKMLTLFLAADANSVAVTGVRIDRYGSSVDSDVSAIRLYHDADRNGIPSGPDTLLGEGALSGGSIHIGGFYLGVGAGVTEQVIALMDVAPNAVADDRVGLRILDASYMEVEAPDLVAPFTVIQSDRVLINVPPVAAGLTVDGFSNGSPEASHLMDTAPRLAWAYTDANVNDVVQGGYNVSVRELPALALRWYVNATGSASAATYAGPALVDGTSYRLEVRLFDTRIWGGPAALVFHMNTPPPAPLLAAPPDLAIGQDPANVTLRWNPVADAEGDVVSYRWFLATRADFLGAVNGTTSPGVASAVALTREATKYYWRVEANDQYEWGPPSATWSFTTLATSGGVFGRVVHAGGGLPANVRMYTQIGGLAAETVTISDGGFAISGVPLGVYEIRVTSPGYEVRIVNVTLTPVDPVRDLSDIELIPLSNPPVVGLDWASLLPWILIIVVAAGAIGGGAVIARRRRRVPGPAAAGTPGARTPRTVAGGSAAVAQELMFECPECGTPVSGEAKTCPGCGALFE